MGSPRLEPEMTEHRLAPHNVVGVLATYDAASGALDALVADDFDPRGELSLLGPEHEMRPAVGHVSEGNGEGASGTATGLVAGGGAGAATGTVATTLAAVAATAIPGVGLAVGSAALIGAAAGAAGGSTVGALLGLEAAGRRTTMWQQTLSPLMRRVQADGVVLVAAHVDDAERAARARDLLSEHGAEVHHLDADVDYAPERQEANVGVTVPSGSPEDPGGVMGPGKDDHELPNA
jgi:hypothetical protein